MVRDIVWERIGPMGLEHLALEVGADGIRADGLVLMQLDDGMIRLAYRLRIDGGWRTRSAELTLDRGGLDRSGSARTLAIEREGDRWSVDGVARADLDGAFDIDIAATPFTNAMPLRRLALAPGVPEAIQVAYVSVPDLEVSMAGQDYTRLGDGRFRYRGIGTGFEAVVTADGDGIVVDYPPIWRRRQGREA